jgi:hypothetical protein
VASLHVLNYWNMPCPVYFSMKNALFWDNISFEFQNTDKFRNFATPNSSSPNCQFIHLQKNSANHTLFFSILPQTKPSYSSLDIVCLIDTITVVMCMENIIQNNCLSAPLYTIVFCVSNSIYTIMCLTILRRFNDDVTCLRWVRERQNDPMGWVCVREVNMPRLPNWHENCFFVPRVEKKLLITPTFSFFYFHYIWNILKVLVSHQKFWKIVFAQIMFFTDKKS